MLIEDDNVLVLMASFNGSKYIQEQIESIQNQTRDDWKLIIRDDGSTDNSLLIINEIIAQDKRIFLLEDAYGSTGSAVLNFCHLLEYAQALKSNYIFLSDQDDVWLPNKLESFISTAKEKCMDNLTPLLVHSDLEVVNDKLELISPSFVESVGLKANEIMHISALTFQNSVTGCACMINGVLLDRIAPVPKNILMHDWWAALVASLSGTIVYIPYASVRYRQHEHNSVGALSYLSLCNPFSALSIGAINESQKFIENCYLQLTGLRERLYDEGHDVSEIEILLRSAKLNRFHRLVYLIQHNCLPSGKGRALGFILRHLLTSKKSIEKYAR
jgi:glycosyltransferase involved in cell wall biosynthesis